MQSVDGNGSRSWLSRLARSARAWLWAVVLLSVMVCGLLAWLQLENRKYLSLAMEKYDLLGQARLDLTRGYLELASRVDESPVRMAQGLALVKQALVDLSDAANVAGAQKPQAANAMSEKIRRFEELLAKLPTRRTAGNAADVELRVAFNELEREADRLDSQARTQLQALGKAQDARFALGLGAAFLLLSAICAMVVIAGRANRRLQQLSRAERERYMLAIEATQDGIWDWNLPSGLIEYTPAYWRMLGYKDKLPASTTLERWQEDLHPDDAPHVLDRIGRSAEKGGEESFQLEFRMRTATGHWKWILGRGRVVSRDDSGRALRMVGTHVDIGDRRSAEQELRVTAAELSTIFEVASVGMVQVNPADGKVLRFNETFRSITGYSAQELLAVHFPDLTHPDDRQADWEVFSKAARGETPDYRNVRRYVRPDGSDVWVRLNAAFVRDADGKPVRTVAVCEDITREKEAEAETAKLNAQLSQAQKMEAVGRLAGGVAHDFNNVIGIIMGNTEIALDKLEPGSGPREELDEVLHAATRAAGLTRQLLAFARRQAAVPRVLDMNAAIGEMHKILRRLIGEDIDLRWAPGNELWPVRIDPSQIDQILANLCVNARDAIKDTGSITIETANTYFDDDYCREHLGYLPGDYVMIAVSDTGSGIDKAVLPNIFEPFFTTKELGKGTGLGLSTVYGVVRQNGGFINVYSEPGSGTVFRIYLPRARDPISSSPVRTPAPITARTSQTILVVEDDSSVLSLTQRILSAGGYKVLAAASPDEALEMATQTDCVALLLTDVIMPVMNGKELAQRVLQFHPNAKVLFMSGYTANVIAHHGVLEQGISFLEKPFGRNDLLRKVHDILRSEE